MEDPFLSQEWEQFVNHVRNSTIEKIAGSGAMISVVADEIDVKFAVELGLGILMDKPLILLCPPGKQISEHLRRVADEIVEADIDLPEGREAFRQALARLFPNDPTYRVVHED